MPGLPDDPLVAFLAAYREVLTAAVPGVLVAGERPPDLLPRLPCVVVARQGGLERDTWQGLIADAPLLSFDCYAAGDDPLPAAFALAQHARRAAYACRTREATGPIQTPDEQEPAGLRRVTFTRTLIAR